MPILMMLAAAMVASPNLAPSTESSARLARQLKTACMSDEGIAIVLPDWEAQETAGKQREVELQRLNAKLIAAANTRPINLTEFEKAAEARDLHRYETDKVATRGTFAILRKLSTHDQAIFIELVDLNAPRGPRPPWLTCK